MSNVYRQLCPAIRRRSYDTNLECKREARGLVCRLLATLLVVSTAGCQPGGYESDQTVTDPEPASEPSAGQSGSNTTPASADAEGEDASTEAPPGSAESPPAEPGEEEVGPEAIASVAVCAVCHGATGEGNRELNAPRIGGLSAWYIARQLENFRIGVRGGTDKDPYGTQMRAIAMTLDEDQTVLEDLGQYFEELEHPQPEATVMGDAERGRELYTVCAACHGEDGRGSVELNAPSLVGQMDWYLVRQLEHYRDGLRGSNPEDTYGMQMVPIMQSLPGDDAIVDLVAYINTLP